MAKHVIILGAGASAQYGAPVMKNFLDEARKLIGTDKILKHADSFTRVFKAISRLQVAQSKAEFDLINLESIFTAFELAKTLNKFPGLDEGGIGQLVEDLKWVIVDTLQAKLLFPVNGATIEAHEGTREFIAAIRGRQQLYGKLDIAILTFNYDLVMDMAIKRAHLGIDYGLAKEPNQAECLPLLKLHGSLNWTTNAQSEVVPWFLGQYLKQLQFDNYAGIMRDTPLPIADQFEHYQNAEGKPEKVDGLPVIVPPSWNKADSHRSISKVWSRAAEELTDASSIYVVGYSLPETDSFFRQLYALGTVGETLLERFWVFNPDASREQAFRSMLGQGARDRFEFHKCDFKKAMSTMSEAICQS